jgi:hypothetical protein
MNFILVVEQLEILIWNHIQGYLHIHKGFVPEVVVVVVVVMMNSEIHDYVMDYNKYVYVPFY